MRHLKQVAVLAAVAGMLALAGCSATAAASVPSDPAPTTIPVDTTSPSASAEPTPAVCPAEYVQTVTANPVLNRFVEGGLKAMPDGVNAEVLSALGHSHLYMVIIGETLFKTSIDDKTLVNEAGDCLSDTGQALMQRFQGAFAMLTASDTTVTTGYNTGIVNGKIVVDTSGVINGDNRAVQFVDKNGKVVLVTLRRCANPILPAPGTYPPGTTDNAKDPRNSVTAVQGAKPLAQNKPITNGGLSAAQKAAGQTSGNVTDTKVANNTGSGTTTTDLGSSSGTAPGASPGGDSAAGTTSGAGQTSTDTGGTNGNGKIADPNLP